MRADEVLALGRSALADHCLDMCGWRFELDRSVRRFGICRYTTRTISVSGPLSALNDLPTVKDTVLHEVAHALAGNTAGHGPKWKATAVRIGAKPERCYDSAEVAEVPHRYEVVCGLCSKVIAKRHRFDRRVDGRKHAGCGGTVGFNLVGS